MKTLISTLATILIVCLPGSGFSNPASINGNVSIWQYDYVPLTQAVTSSSGNLNMNDFNNNEEYKILIVEDAPLLINNLQMSIGLVDRNSGSAFTYTTGNQFKISYNLPINTQIGQTQLLKFQIYRKRAGIGDVKPEVGIWDWQTTFYYYVNTTCSDNYDLTFNDSNGYPLYGQDYEVSANLSVSTMAFPNGGITELDGGSSVSLLPGFSSNLSGGGAILIINDGCGGAYRLNNPVNDVNDSPVNIVNYKNDNIVIYPNPTNELISITIPKATTGEKIKVDTRDINGRVLFSEERIYDQNSPFDLKHLKPGLYFITISGSDLNYNQKIIKQ